MFTVFGMSIVMTGIANAIVFGVNTAWLGHVTAQRARNFVAVLLAEAIIIQPIARTVMAKIHRKQHPVHTTVLIQHAS